MSATLDYFERQLKDSLSAALITAIWNDDSDMIAMLRNSGADAGHVDRSNATAFKYVGAKEREDEFMSPVAYAIRSGKSDLLRDLIGTSARVVPEGAIVDGKVLSMFELLATEKDSGFLPIALPDLAACMDLSAPAVAHAWWDMALQTLKPKGGNTHPDYPQSNVAISILDYGGTPADGVDGVLALLNSGVVYKDRKGSVHPFVDSLACSGFARNVIERMLDVGLGPDTTIGDIPLLHYAAMTNNVGMAIALIDAGADPRATCEWSTLERYLSSTITRADPSAALATATDTADVFGRDVTPYLKSAVARYAIMDVVRAGARKSL